MSTLTWGQGSETARRQRQGHHHCGPLPAQRHPRLPHPQEALTQLITTTPLTPPSVNATRLLTCNFNNSLTLLRNLVYSKLTSQRGGDIMVTTTEAEYLLIDLSDEEIDQRDINIVC